MKKKIGVIAIALALLTVFAVGIVFADGKTGNISWTAYQVHVTNPDTKKARDVSGSICVWLINSEGVKMPDDHSYSLKKVGAGKSMEIYRTKSPGWTIIRVDDKTCFFEE